MAGANTLEFTDDNFETEVLNSETPVLVDFWAEWCAPCRALSPTIDAIADEYSGKAKIGKVNIESAQAIAIKYGVGSIPTVLIFKGGQVTKQFVGLRNKEEFTEALNESV